MNDNSTTGDLLNFSKQSTDSILVIEQTTTILNLIGIINKNDFYGYPIIESLDNKIVIGFIERNDLVAILENLKTVDQSTKVLFINHKMEKNIPKKQDVTPLTSNKIDIPLIFSDIVNYAPMTINILTPTHILIETFRKLGLRQIIVTDGG
ncbi:hypothetical protein A3Q56_08481 [Intoshia linei]|uniref:CBS domain-containing protein n=1 Tax=Intoshia linei TaxID=1819745 RepID=A0A177AR12_9BILA|nr:hypothetical protein A3Q56_08481 [Intoshia linei]